MGGTQTEYRRGSADGSGARSRNPFAQARAAMFDIRDAAQRAYVGEFEMPFRYFAARISSAAHSRWSPWGLPGVR